MSLEVSVARECIDETYRFLFGVALAAWLLGSWCWKHLAVGYFWIFLFTYLYLFYFSYLWLSLFYAMMILNPSMHTTGTPGRGGHRAYKVTT